MVSRLQLSNDPVHLLEDRKLHLLRPALGSFLYQINLAIDLLDLSILCRTGAADGIVLDHLLLVRLLFRSRRDGCHLLLRPKTEEEDEQPQPDDHSQGAHPKQNLLPHLFTAFLYCKGQTKGGLSKINRLVHMIMPDYML